MNGFIGHIEFMGLGVAGGWVWDSADPATVHTVEMVVNGIVYSTTTANMFRKDLAVSKIGNGKHGFIFRDPIIQPGHHIQFRPRGYESFLPLPDMLSAETAQDSGPDAVISPSAHSSERLERLAQQLAASWKQPPAELEAYIQVIDELKALVSARDKTVEELRRELVIMTGELVRMRKAAAK